MAEIEVTPSRLREIGAQVGGVGAEVEPRAADVRRFEGHAGGAPPATERALRALATNSDRLVHDLAESVSDLGRALEVIAEYYELTDAQAMPGGG